MFLNFTNHPSDRWSPAQRRAADAWGEIVDLPFPAVPADADEADVAALADACCAGILARKPDAVLCQGEFTLTCAVVRRLLDAGVLTLSACSERASEETALPDGSTERRTVFRFVRFRRYG